MSGSPPVPGHLPRSPPESSPPTTTPNPLGGRRHEAGSQSSRDTTEVRREALPPIEPSRRSSTPATSHTEAGPSRSLHVHNILNPTQHTESANPESEPRRAGPSSHSPTAIATPQQRSGSISRAPDPESSQIASHVLTPSSTTAESETGAPHHREPRRILTPKTLSSLPASTLGRMSFPGTINAQESPFLSSSRPYSSEMAPMQIPESMIATDTPTPGRVPGMSLGYPSSAPTPPPGTRRASGGPMPAPLSQSASPSTSYSSFSQQSQTSPAPPHGLQPVSLPGASSGFSFNPQSGSGGPAKSSYRPLPDSLPQGGVQLWTLATEHGPIQVPVDVQAASKMADDKRKRNAGASARFRQRRKEKEREASDTISKLEQQVRDMAEERDFYRQERDHFRRVASGNGQSTPRPSSPRLRKMSGEDSSGRRGSEKWREPGPSSEAERNTRRRTDEITPAPQYSLPPPNAMVAPAQPPQQSYGLPPMVHPPHYNARGPPPRPGPASSSAGTPKTEPYEPSMSERYGRNWPPNRDPR